MYMFLLIQQKVDSRVAQREHLGMFFGGVGVCWAPFGANCCSKVLYMVQHSIYAIFQGLAGQARIQRTMSGEGKWCGLGPTENQQPAC